MLSAEGPRHPYRRASVSRAVPEKLKKVVASNQQWKCNYCCETLIYTYQVDHVIPLHDGGDNSIHNLQALCPNCHAEKTFTETISQQMPLPPTGPMRRAEDPNQSPLSSHSCSRCHKRLCDKRSLDRHTKVCNGVLTMQCPTCHKAFKSYNGKYHHIKHVKCEPVVQNTTNNGNSGGGADDLTVTEVASLCLDT